MNKLQRTILILPFCLASLSHAQTIDVAIAYTPAVQVANGGTKNLNAKINQKFRFSASPFLKLKEHQKIRINLKAKSRVSWRRSGTTFQTLRQLSFNKGVTFRNLRNVRPRKKADIMALITTGTRGRNMNFAIGSGLGYAVMGNGAVDGRANWQAFGIAKAIGVAMGAIYEYGSCFKWIRISRNKKVKVTRASVMYLDDAARRKACRNYRPEGQFTSLFMRVAGRRFIREFENSSAMIHNAPKMSRIF